jgi:hypothetical protein
MLPRVALFLFGLPLVPVSLAVAAPPYQGKPVRVILLAGQSNMAGSGAVSRAPLPWRNQPGILFDETTASFDHTRSSSWETLGLAVANMGPEISFGALVSEALPGEQIALVKVSRAGTGLAYWRTPGQGGHDALMNRIDTIKTRLNAAVTAGEIPSWRFGGLLWMQGENEADGAAPMALTYQADFADFVSKVRVRTSTPTLPVVLGRISIQLDPGAPYFGPVEQPQLDNVRAAQVAWTVANAPHGAWVDTDDLSLIDEFHFGSVAQLTFGRRFARTYLALVEPAPLPLITRLAGQAASSSSPAVAFRVDFGRPVTGFTSADVTVLGETGATSAGVTVAALPPGDGSVYAVHVRGLVRPGQVDIAVPRGAALDAQARVSLPGQSEDVAVVWAPHPGVAGLILHDPMANGPSALLNTAATGHGWTGQGWEVQNNRTGYQFKATGTPLTYGALATTPGYAEGGDNWVSSARALDFEKTFRPWMSSRAAAGLDIAGSEFWVSWLVRPLSAGRAQRVALARGTGIAEANSTITVDNNGGKWRFTVLGTATTTNVDATANQTHLMVLQVFIGGAAQPSTARLWINPAPALLGGAALAPGTATVAHTTAAPTTDFTFRRLFWFPGDAPGHGALDEVRLGTTFASVTPVAAPAPSPLAAALAAQFAAAGQDHLAPAVFDPALDHDGDGLNGLMEAYWGANAADSARSGPTSLPLAERQRPSLRLAAEPGSGLTLELPAVSPLPAGVQVRWEHSPDLAADTWTPLVAGVDYVASSAPGATPGLQWLGATLPTPTTRAFYRAVIAPAP